MADTIIDNVRYMTEFSRNFLRLEYSINEMSFYQRQRYLNIPMMSYGYYSHLHPHTHHNYPYFLPSYYPYGQRILNYPVNYLINYPSYQVPLIAPSLSPASTLPSCNHINNHSSIPVTQPYFIHLPYQSSPSPPPASSSPLPLSLPLPLSALINSNNTLHMNGSNIEHTNSIDSPLTPDNEDPPFLVAQTLNPYENNYQSCSSETPYIWSSPSYPYQYHPITSYSLPHSMYMTTSATITPSIYLPNTYEPEKNSLN